MRATKSVHFYLIETARAAPPGAVLRELPERTFVRSSDLPGSSSARRNARSHVAIAGDLIGVRNGLYYKGVKSRFGMTRPSSREVAREVLGVEGVGRRVSAQHAFWG